MNAIKQCLIIISLFALLLAVVFAPMLYMEYQNNNRLNDFRLSPVKTIRLDDPSQKVQDYNIWKHIGIINKSIVVRSTVPTGSKTELLQKMEEQIAAICRCKALPEISFADAIEISVFKETYMDQLSSDDRADLFDLERVLHIWEIIADYKNYAVHAYMDAKTNAIYEITITAKVSAFLYRSEITDTGFVEYLKTFSDIPSDLGMTFFTGSYYSDEKICLYLYSVREDSKLTIYRFDHTVAADAYPMYVVTENDG